MTVAEKFNWQPLCKRNDLVANSGVCALVGDEQVALFFLPAEEQVIYALANRDPIGEANVMSRGIIGDLGGELVVASPLYKQHYKLTTGECLEHDDVALATYSVRLEGDDVLIAL